MNHTGLSGGIFSPHIHILRKNQRRIRALLLFAFAVFQTACSTPPVVEHQQEPETAWESYLYCLQRVRSANLCNNVGTSGSYSYNQYSFGSYSAGGDSFVGGFRGVVGVSDSSKSLFDQAYLEYLRSLDPSDLEKLAAEWKEIGDRGYN